MKEKRYVKVEQSVSTTSDTFMPSNVKTFTPHESSQVDMSRLSESHFFELPLFPIAILFVDKMR